MVVYRDNMIKLKAKSIENGKAINLQNFPKDLSIPGTHELFSVRNRNKERIAYITGLVQNQGETSIYCNLENAANNIKLTSLPSSSSHCEIVSSQTEPILITKDKTLKLYGNHNGKWIDILSSKDHIPINSASKWLSDAERGHLFHKNPNNQLEVTTFVSSVIDNSTGKLDWKKSDQKYIFKSTVLEFYPAKEYQLGAVVGLIDKENPNQLKFYRYIENPDEFKLEELTKRKAKLLSAVKSVETLKELGQIAETMGEFESAIVYYEQCLDFLDQKINKAEYSYINAHLITCKFLLATTKDTKQDFKDINSIDSDKSIQTNSQASSGLSAENLVQESQKSRTLLKNIARKVQEHPSLKNNIEGMKKVNMALALINQWQDEIVPREGFEFIDEQLGVLTNLISLIQGNQLNIQMNGNKMSFSDSGLGNLLDNLEAMNQLKALEGRNFTDEELESVALKEVSITDEISFVSGLNQGLISGKYVLVDSKMKMNVEQFKRPNTWIERPHQLDPDQQSNDYTPIKDKASYYTFHVIGSKIEINSATEMLQNPYSYRQPTYPGMNCSTGRNGGFHIMTESKLTGTINWGNKSINYTNTNLTKSTYGESSTCGGAGYRPDVPAQSTNSTSGVIQFEILESHKLKFTYNNGSWAIYKRVSN